MRRAPSQPVVHLELHTSDAARARAFYEELWGWSAVSLADGAHRLELGGDVGGAIVESAPVRPLWLPHVEVPDVGPATSRAWLLGATVVGEPRAVPGGRRSDVASPCGGRIAFWQPGRCA
jgi:uncharacterized protein